MTMERIRDQLLSQLKEALSSLASVTEKEHNVLEIRHTMNLDRRLTISLEDLAQKIEDEPAEENRLIRDLVQRVRATMKSMGKGHHLVGNEGRIYPVLRHTSFPKESKEGFTFVTKEHTAESTIFYALDLGESYILIHEEHLQEAGWTNETLQEHAIRNILKLDSTPKTDQVGENVFYFISRGDGYSASRILNPKLIEWMERKVTGELGVAIPHQEVLIFADLRDKKGYQVLAQIAMDFARKGDVPISALPYIVENGKLEPFMAVNTRPPAKNRTHQRKPNGSKPKK
jgi:uncharacterized protein YtpQ (UPF0354 family)